MFIRDDFHSHRTLFTANQTTWTHTINRRYKIKESLDFFRDMAGSDLRGLDSLLVKICHHAALPSALTDWKQLLADLQTLAGTDSSGASLARLHELYVGSLLRHGSKATIAIAKAHLASDTCPLDQDMARNVVVVAAQEHFNAANDSKDPELEVAKRCIALCHPDHPRVAAELRLIEAQAALAELGLLVPPASVRVSRNRGMFVEHILTERQGAYRQEAQMLRLASLLGVASDDAAGGGNSRILCMLARSALAHGDHAIAIAYGKRLMQEEGHTSWDVLRDIALQPQVDDIACRKLFLGHALQHGPREALLETLDAFRVLEVVDVCVVDDVQPAQSSPVSRASGSLDGAGASDGEDTITLQAEFAASRDALLAVFSPFGSDESERGGIPESGYGDEWQSNWHPYYHSITTPLAAQPRRDTFTPHPWLSPRTCSYGRAWSNAHMPRAAVDRHRRVMRGGALLRAAALEQRKDDCIVPRDGRFLSHFIGALVSVITYFTILPPSFAVVRRNGGGGDPE